MIDLLPGTADQKLSWHFLHSDLACTWWKMIELHPEGISPADQKNDCPLSGTADHNIT